MKLKYQMVLQQVGTQWFAVAVGDNARECNGMLTLNETGSRLIELLQQEHTEEELEQLVLDEYEGDEQQIRQSVRDFVKQLQDAGMMA